MLFIDYENFLNIAKKLSKSGVEFWSFFAKQRNRNNSIIIKSICLYIIKIFFKVFVVSWRFLKLEYTIFNTNLIMILQGVKLESAYIVEKVKIDWFKLILENLYNFFF